MPVRTRRWDLRLSAVLLVVTMAVIAAGCTDVKIDARKGKPKAGVVRDRDSGRPVAGAYVTYEWWETVSSLVDTGSHCFHLEVRRSDDSGTVEIPVREGYLPSAVVVYARGYERPPLAYTGETEFALARSAGSRDARFEYVIGLVTVCRDKDAERKLRDVDGAMLDELRELATSDTQKEMVKQRTFARPRAVVR